MSDKFISLVLLLALSSSSMPATVDSHDYIVWSVDNQEIADIVVRVGEYPNKPGKRIYLEYNELHLANNVKVHKDEKGYYVSEYDINLQLASKVVRNLEQEGIKVKLLTSQSKQEDLNSAGRKAMSYNPKVYFSIHHNYYSEDSTGYFIMVNKNSPKETEIANRISNSISKVSSIRQMETRVQDGYIGEMNETDSTLNFLYEGGFFSNKSELYVITSKEHTDKVAKVIATELIKTLKGANN